MTLSNGTVEDRVAWVVANALYNPLHRMYYDICVKNREPCLTLIRGTINMRLDLDMTSSFRVMTPIGQMRVRMLLQEFTTDEVVVDAYSARVNHLPNKRAEVAAEAVAAVLREQGMTAEE